MTLDTYQRKRDFSRTSEPRGEEADVRSSRHRFVVQEHHASHLHFDLRLEVNGILKSWAVPKGPPPDTSIRRLAIMTEDHPLEYLTFSGSIPVGNYGAGEMSIWDHGTFDSVGKDSVENGLREGKIEIVFHGEKLIGKYDLIRTDDEHNQWIFIKSKQSSGLSAIGPSVPITEDQTQPSAAVLVDVRNAVPASMPDPDDVSPMLAVTLDQPFSDPDWQFEIKWDGYRSILFMRNGLSKMVSRNKLPLDSSFQELEGLDAWLECKDAIIDGEIVALDGDGRPQFQALQNRFRGRPGLPKSTQLLPDVTFVYMAFDLLHCDGLDITAAPLIDRRKLLAGLIKPGGPVRFSDHVIGDGIALFDKLRNYGMEGIVAKRSDSPYVQERSRDWAKIKAHRTVDVVIAGYTESDSPNRPFAALLVGEYRNDELISVGHVGTGFNDATMLMLMQRLKPLATETMPFINRPRLNGKPQWMIPELVCEVKYDNITADRQLRHPVFVELRPDKPVKECMLTDLPAPLPSSYGENTKIVKPKTESTEDAKKSTLEKVLAKGESADSAQVIAGHHRLSLTHLGKVFWAETGVTKRDLLRYYETVAEFMLPHLHNRPLVFQRYPDGVGSNSFFQHNAGDKLPSFIRTYDVVENGDHVHYALCDDIAALLYFVNLGAIPFHAWNIEISAPEMPDRIVFDLDPSGSFSTTIYVAHTLKAILDEIGLASYSKTSGANGLHIYVPIEPIYSESDVVNFARLIGQLVQQRIPDLVTVERRISKRGSNHVYMDCLQNGIGKTVVAPYSVRAQPRPTVSTPLRWDEVSDSLMIEMFTIDTVPERLKYYGDLFLPVLKKPQRLGEVFGRLSTLSPRSK